VMRSRVVSFAVSIWCCAGHIFLIAPLDDVWPLVSFNSLMESLVTVIVSAFCFHYCSVNWALHLVTDALNLSQLFMAMIVSVWILSLPIPISAH
jgi:hypothetical protein